MRADFGANEPRDVSADGFHERFKVDREVKPARRTHGLADEGTAALLAPDEALAFQHVDGLAHGDARHLELVLQFIERRQLLPRLKLPLRDAATQQHGDLDVERDRTPLEHLCRCHLVHPPRYAAWTWGAASIAWPVPCSITLPLSSR